MTEAQEGIPKHTLPDIKLFERIVQWTDPNSLAGNDPRLDIIHTWWTDIDNTSRYLSRFKSSINPRFLPYKELREAKTVYGGAEYLFNDVNSSINEFVSRPPSFFDSVRRVTSYPDELKQISAIAEKIDGEFATYKPSCDTTIAICEAISETQHTKQSPSTIRHKIAQLALENTLNAIDYQKMYRKAGILPPVSDQERILNAVDDQKMHQQAEISPSVSDQEVDQLRDAYVSALRKDPWDEYSIAKYKKSLESLTNESVPIRPTTKARLDKLWQMALGNIPQDISAVNILREAESIKRVMQEEKALHMAWEHGLE